MSAVAVAVCQAHTFDLVTEEMSPCARSAGYRVEIESDCSSSTGRLVCDSHLLTLRSGATKCIDGRHVVRMVSVERVGGAA